MPKLVASEDVIELPRKEALGEARGEDEHTQGVAGEHGQQGPHDDVVGHRTVLSVRTHHQGELVRGHQAREYHKREDGIGQQAIAPEPGHGHDGDQGGGQEGNPPHVGVRVGGVAAEPDPQPRVEGAQDARHDSQHVTRQGALVGRVRLTAKSVEAHGGGEAVEHRREVHTRNNLVQERQLQARAEEMVYRQNGDRDHSDKVRENVARFVVEEGERMHYCLHEACGFLRQRAVAADDVRPSGVFGHLCAETQPSTSTRK
mmetsp:Transcript_15965/g.26960  ORF Transcript_15965/g.26960 Transcript_15965/m.26960 type:complete len:259 (-) Transcript_15965:228-1004(-)